VASEYTVRLDRFEGPLDLLLFLIRRAEVEITDIPVAVIADQYIAFLQEGLGEIDIDAAGEFLVMAATLTELKSRVVSPTAPSGAGGGGPAEGEGRPAPGDPRTELVKQLLEYKAFRDAARALERRRAQWEGRYPARGAAASEPPSPAPDAGGPLDLEDVSLSDLVEAFARVLRTVDLGRVGTHRVVVDDTPIELHAADLVDRLRREAAAGGGLGFAAVFAGRTRSEALGLFLAMLELVRRRVVTVRQETVHGEIMLELAPGEPDLAADAAAPGASGQGAPAP